MRLSPRLRVLLVTLTLLPAVSTTAPPASAAGLSSPTARPSAAPVALDAHASGDRGPALATPADGVHVSGRVRFHWHARAGHPS